MYVAAETQILIQAPPEAIWDYAANPAHWTASNPEEHFGLEYDSPENRPGPGVEFHQRESVAGIYADLRGRFLYVDQPRVAVWSGTAAYRLLGGLLVVRIPEGGVLRLEEGQGQTRLSHDVYMDYPDSAWGRILHWLFERVLRGREAVYTHAQKELVFFKEQLERRSGEEVQETRESRAS